MEKRSTPDKPSPARAAALRGRGRAARQIGRAGMAALAGSDPAGRTGLAGFDPDYADIVDYTIRSTQRIVNERGVGLIYGHYKHDATVHTPLRVLRSRDEVIADALRVLAAYSDLRGTDHAVVWTGNAGEGFYTSHLSTMAGRNTGWSEYGPPSERKVTWIAIADRVVFANRVCESWVVHDTMAMVQQMGLDPRAVARALAAQRVARGESLADFGEVGRLHGQNPPPDQFEAPGAAEPAEALVCQALHDLWNRRRFDTVRDAYARDAVAHFPGMRDLKGRNAIADAAIAVLAMMSDAGLIIQHVCSVAEGRDGRRVALRWLLDGHHDGAGRLGAPTGRRLSMMGMTHAHVRGGRIVEEWTVFDELSLLVQVEMPTQ